MNEKIESDGESKIQKFARDVNGAGAFVKSHPKA
jgi:hypothetical protein